MDKVLRIIRSRRVDDENQYLYPEVVFSCNGTVTKWIYGGISQQQDSLTELQIWRQLGPNSYTKIGSSSVNAGTMIGTNLYEFIPQTPLEFQEGDIFGLHDLSLLYEQRFSGPLNLRIRSDDSLSTITQDLDTDGNDFPLVTVEVSSKYLSHFYYSMK